MKVTDFIAEFLAANNINVVFGYQGSSVAHLIDSICNNTNLKFVETRHEQAAAFAANGYAAVKQGVGAALSCSGPGALNLINGIANAYYDSLPCIFFTGQVSQKEMKYDKKVRQVGFQETDVVSVVKPITKYVVTLSKPEDILVELPKALKIAVEGRPGPVLLDLPHNIQGSQIADTVAQIVNTEKVQEQKLESNVFHDVVTYIQNAKRPVFILGGGCRYLPDKVMKLCEVLQIPVVTSYLGKTHYDNSLKNYCGTIGVFGERYANWALKFSDLIVVLGSRLDGRQTAGESLQKDIEANVIAIDVDPEELSNMPKTYKTVNFDAAAFFNRLVEGLGCNEAHKKWLDTILVWKERYPIENEYLVKDGVNPNLFLKKLSGFLPSKATIALDVGQNQLWGNTSLVIQNEQKLLQSGGLGSMGYSLPAVIGAYFAGNESVISFNGDGGFQMNIQELQTIQTYKIPAKIFVFNNKCLGLIRDYQAKALGSRFYGSVEGFGSPDYKYIAMAYGLKYLHITNNDEISMIEDIIKDDSGYIIEIAVSQLSTGCPEPVYLLPIINQAPVISDAEKKQVLEEVQRCK